MKVLFIQTGGTIDKDYARGAGTYNFDIAEPAVERILQQINPSFEYRVVSVARKDSMDLNDKDRQSLLQTCQNAPENLVVITHGTDTMTATGKFLSSIKNKTIIITGSARPERFVDTDAVFNVGTAIGALASVVPGLYIAMNGIVMPHDKIKKNPQNGQFQVVD